MILKVFLNSLAYRLNLVSCFYIFSVSSLIYSRNLSILLSRSFSLFLFDTKEYFKASDGVQMVLDDRCLLCALIL